MIYQKLQIAWKRRNNDTPKFWSFSMNKKPISVAERSKRNVCGCSFAGVPDSNTAGRVEACLLWLYCVDSYRSLRRADHSHRRVLPTVVSLCVIYKPQEQDGRGPRWVVAPQKQETNNKVRVCATPLRISYLISGVTLTACNSSVYRRHRFL